MNIQAFVLCDIKWLSRKAVFIGEKMTFLERFLFLEVYTVT